jgi:hypothetical protein
VHAARNNGLYCLSGSAGKQQFQFKIVLLEDTCTLTESGWRTMPNLALAGRQSEQIGGACLCGIKPREERERCNQAGRACHAVLHQSFSFNV